jgi:hypothetical protein
MLCQAGDRLLAVSPNFEPPLGATFQSLRFLGIEEPTSPLPILQGEPLSTRAPPAICPE